MADQDPQAGGDRWDAVSAWANAWLVADGPGRERLRASLAVEHPDLFDEAESLARASDRLNGFLETPALMLAAEELAQDDDLLPAGATIGPYRIVRLLARGGMGDVYHANDLRLGRDVALKVLANTRTDDAERLGRFMNEARITASLDHPNVVRIYDVGQADERAYLVAELLQGETLRARVGRGPMPGAEVLRLAIELARGLGAAHAAGLVHRDLKPENIFLTAGGPPKVLDFGIAKLTQDDTVRDGFSTLTGVVLGTAGYLAPEQIRGERVDATADLFGLGAVLFEALTGSRAFARDHLVETLYAILHEHPRHTLAERDDVPPALIAIVSRLLEKSPLARYQSASDLLAALEHVDASAVSSPSTPAPSLRTPFDRPSRGDAPVGVVPLARRTVWAAVGVVAVLTTIAGFARFGWPGRSSVAEPAAAVTVAVMPFRTIPSSAADELLQLGLADVLVSRLGRLTKIQVLPLTATERLAKQPDPVQAVRQLGATHLLTGTIQHDRRAVRATVQLLRTSDHRTIWTTPIDAGTLSVFSIQDIIVSRVVDELAPQLAAGARRLLSDPGTQSNDALEAYLRGRAFVMRPTRAELRRAIEQFNEAIRLDPSYADAWAGLASAFKRLPVGGDIRPSEAFEAARKAANEALRLDGQNAEAYTALGAVAFWYEWDYPNAERLTRRALELQPSSADAQIFLAHLYSNLGRHEEALDGIRRARALDPAWPVPRSLEGQFLFMARRYDEALDRLDALVQIEPRFSNGHVMRVYPLLALQRYDEARQACAQVLALRRGLDRSEPLYSWAAALDGFALARMGRSADAGQVLDELRRAAREQFVSPYAEALVLHALGRDDEALERLRAAVQVRDHRVTFLGVDPKWDGLRGAPAFRDLLAQVNLTAVVNPVSR